MSALPRIEGAAAPLVLGGWRGMLSDYYELGKPRIVFLLLITTAAAMAMAARGVPPLGLTFWTLLAGGLAALSAGAFNCVIDRDIDRLMRRTMNRPVAARRMSVSAALTFATITGLSSFWLFFTLVNPLSAWLSLSGEIYYVVIYTIWLKRTTPLNIVIGGAAGAVPPLVGWSAVTGTLGMPALGLFLLIFLWTPPHFWSLALMTDVDYEKAGIPMLPAVAGIARTKNEIFMYSLILVGASLLLAVFHVMGALYAAGAAVLGAVFIVDAARLFRDQTKKTPRALFKYSLLYLALLCAVMVADRIIS